MGKSDGGAKSFPMFPSYIDALRRLDLEDRWDMIEAMNDFATTGAEPAFDTGNVVAKQIAWDLIVPTLGRSVSRAKTNAANRAKRKDARAGFVNETERKTKQADFVNEAERTETKTDFVNEKSDGGISLFDKEEEVEVDEDVEEEGKKKGKKKEPKHAYGDYRNVMLTDSEVDRLAEEFPADWESRIERLSEYVASSGKRYKSHYATIRAWARKDAKPPGPPASGAVDGFWGAA